MRKSIIVFIAALVLNLGLWLLSYRGNSALYFLVGILGSFVLFYFIGKTVNLRVEQSTVIVLFVGLFVGALVSSGVLVSFSFPNYFGALVGYFEAELLALVNYTLGLFFPALAALFFAESRMKKILKSDENILFLQK